MSQPIRPRPHQEKASSLAADALRSGRSPLVVMPTGTGKTLTALMAVQKVNPENRVLYLTHLREQGDQFAAAIAGYFGEEPATERGRSRSTDRDRHVVASVQTLCRGGRVADLRPESFGLVVVDEAHHFASAPAWHRVVAAFRAAGVPALSLTATPGENMRRVADCNVFNWHVAAACRQRWLVPVRPACMTVTGIDLRDCPMRVGDYDPHWLDAVLAEEGPAHRVVTTSLELLADRSTIVYTAGKLHARAIAAMFNRYRAGAAVWVSDDSTPAERADAVAGFREGRYQWLVNCSMFLEAFDAVNCSAVVVARPTRSVKLLTQIVGRPLRVLPGVLDGPEYDDDRARRAQAVACSDKPNAVVLDFVNASDTKILQSADVLGAEYPPEIRERAKGAIPKGDGDDPPEDVDLEKLLSKAAAMFSLEREEQERRKRILCTATYRADDVDLFGRGSVSGTATDTPDRGPPATDAQKQLLLQLGLPLMFVARLSKRIASGVIAKEMGKRRERNGGAA